MDIILFVLVIFAWVGVVIFRRFHHYSQNRPAIKDAATLVGYWGSYEAQREARCEARFEAIGETSSENSVKGRHALQPVHASHIEGRESAELCLRILKRLG